MKKTLALLLSLSLLSCSGENTLEDRLDAVIKDKKLRVGVAILDMKSGELTEINGRENFPLQSVFKFHIAAKVLDDVDKGKLHLDQPIAVPASEILENTWSPLRDEHGKKDLNMRLDSLVYYMVASSDNNACDILLRRVGGPEAVNDYIRSLGISGTQIEVNEEQMHQDWETQFRNVATPVSTVEVLKKFYLREFLSGDMHNFLWAQMVNSTTGLKRLKAGVPAGTVTAHKTGSSGRNAEGLSAATNDAGIIVLPDGQAYIISVFVTDSRESDEVNEKVIADIAKALTER
ncbi:MAG: class A beta-lactamase, subclass A2 [Leadbetterella sp.]|nr:class A beta-lactamase, subclass A2 [Leadbetterella sp.]